MSFENMTAVEIAATLYTAAKAFDSRNDEFAQGKGAICRDIASRVASRGFASAKQAEFAAKLVSWSAPKQAKPAEAVAVNENAVGRVRRLFETAKSNGLKFPKIRLQTAEGEKLVIGMAGERSKYTGDLMLTDGQPFGSNRYYGRISGNELHAGRDLSDGVRALLTALGDRPEQAAEAYGRLTGSCCFCARELEDGRSVAVGYGPVCAEKYGLEWGSERVATANKEAVAI